MVDLDATLGEKLFEVPVGQPVPQVPAHRQQDHLGRETEPVEPRQHRHRLPRTASALHRATLTAPVRSVNATEPARPSVLCGVTPRCVCGAGAQGVAPAAASGAPWQGNDGSGVHERQTERTADPQPARRSTRLTVSVCSSRWSGFEVPGQADGDGAPLCLTDRPSRGAARKGADLPGNRSTTGPPWKRMRTPSLTYRVLLKRSRRSSSTGSSSGPLTYQILAMRDEVFRVHVVKPPAGRGLPITSDPWGAGGEACPLLGVRAERRRPV